MAEEKFARRDVDRAFRKFNDLTNDVMNAKFQTWGDSFTHLITHCENNPVMQVITTPLRGNRNVNASKWYCDAISSQRGMVGSGEYKLPIDDDDRTALLYQFFLLIEDDKADIANFCITVYGVSQYQEMLRHFNNELVSKFTREVSYRLNEITEDIGEAREVSRDAMMVFHIQDHSMTIHGNIQGSNVAAGGSTISGSTARYNTNAELADALKALKPIVHEVAANQKEAVEAALGVLVKATEDAAISKDEVAAAATTVASASPKFKEWLLDLPGKVIGAMAGSVVVTGVKAAFGLP